MKYSPKFFYCSLPKWKRAKDPVFVKLIFRPLSYVVSSFFASLQISANTISYLNILNALICIILIGTGIFSYAIIGVVFAFIWLLFDCVDGNIARSVKKQAYGEFADAASSYLLIGGLFSALGIYCYKNGGIIFNIGDINIVILGVIASASDTMVRLYRNKFLLEPNFENKNISSGNHTKKN